MNSIIAEAVSNKKQLFITYNGARRLVDPHAYGVDRHGRLKLRAYQNPQEGTDEDHAGWRLFSEDAIVAVEDAPGSFQVRDDYKANDSAFADFIERV